MIKQIAAISLTGLLLAGCQTTNPYTGEQEVNKTTKYGGVGALAGAVVGGLANGKKGALAGAALGGAAGAGYGYYTDQQEAALRQRLQGTGVQVQRTGNDLKLIMPGNITFATNSYNIQSSFYSVLGSVALVLKEFDENPVEVVGHTDSTGSRQHNMGLSEKRAQSVASYLVNQGVAGPRITYFGAGPDQPIASNGTKQGRALNRRVELNLRPPAQ
ncbi:OmpA family protein [Aestuariirhabdus sp. Z084]|uniref:OmpA family protein n=1 Tax=Aestuariirhabdus haliotis TaxID=2918751 RepID=UPI00201B40B2|nr:OmpA family protein [Aestuariirhabdus haliotis]MCL6417412.1 OmpA family protein [Aestuariirhabdus haliotis]MCL6421356.1 OmpA family protein [Aestuariirhabdus haliotis]